VSREKVVIDAFRLINPQLVMLGQEPRQTTSNLGSLKKPSIQALIHNLNRHYYSINISYRKNDLEQKMLLNLHKRKWTDQLKTRDFEQHAKKNAATVKNLLSLAKSYSKWLAEEDTKTAEEFEVAQVGKLDPKKHLQSNVEDLMASNIVQVLGFMTNTVVF
jgi:26S proteasome regulatory subunit N11